MIITESMQKSLNDQINSELYSAYLYLAMSAYLESVNFTGAAHWMRKQTQEEFGHAMKLYSYIIERGGKVTLKAIKEPPVKWSSLLDVFQKSYGHEQQITELIHKLVTQAEKEKDYATRGHLDWFIQEQVEEEASALAVIEKLKMAGDFTGGLLMIDRELGQRQ